MKRLKKILLSIILVIALASILAVITGNSHLFKAVSTTYLVGKTGPSIDEHAIFESRKIETETYQPWLVSKNYNSTTNDSLHQEIENYKPAAFLVAKNDSIIYEEYWDEYNENSITNSFSMAKSFIGLLVGIALDEGKINSVNDPIGNYLPQYKDNPELTIKHLLTMSSGIDFDESYKSPFGHMAKAYYGTDIKKLNENYKVTETPGVTWKYLGGNTIILSFLIEKVAGMSVSEYMSKTIWQRIGAKNEALWSLDKKDGLEKAYCCFYSNARDFARIGKLYLHNGLWNNERIISENYIKNSIAAAYPLKTPEGKPVDFYGYHVWTTYYKNLDISFCRGIQGQYIITIPEKNLVIVRLGHKRSKEFINNIPSDVYTYIDFALEQ
ncbi:serine hydrolase [Vicingus serpentipes]|uniref:Serine hydrolase n=1 Tax=Vicingus serpentipes TaxID=1926625 RepID=A0A5C6RYS9_9FLAO|nr:serine hydrolase [Vicingus serpentipes]TXB67244.1 serine hydrolase [Vicingus serpentipes]